MPQILKGVTLHTAPSAENFENVTGGTFELRVGINLHQNVGICIFSLFPQMFEHLHRLRNLKIIFLQIRDFIHHNKKLCHLRENKKVITKIGI